MSGNNDNLTYRCYVLPIVAAILFLLLSYPQFDIFFSKYISDFKYRLFAKALIVLVILFILCRIMDNCCNYGCH